MKGVEILSFLSARRKAGLTQAAVAEHLGISAASVCLWEAGKTVPDSRKLPAIARLYGCTVDELLEDEEKEVPT